MEAFAGRLTEYKYSKGTIQLPYSKPLPLELIAEIAVWFLRLKCPIGLPPLSGVPPKAGGRLS